MASKFKNETEAEYETRRLRMVFFSIYQRCYSEKFKQYKDYGGRGIRVDQEAWPKNEYGVQNFLKDMGPRPRDELGVPFTVERIDINGPYSPSNCIWLSRWDQADNKQKNSGKPRPPKLPDDIRAAKNLKARKDRYFKNHGTMVGFEEGKRVKKNSRKYTIANPDLFA